MVDRITDLPVNYSKYLTNRRPPSRSLSVASHYEQPQVTQPQFSQTEPAQQYRTTTYNHPGLSLTSVIRLNQIVCRLLRTRCLYDNLSLLVHQSKWESHGIRTARRSRYKPIGIAIEIRLEKSSEDLFILRDLRTKPCPLHNHIVSIHRMLTADTHKDCSVFFCNFFSFSSLFLI